MPFADWLGQQIGRQDNIGVFARYAMRDKVFQRIRHEDALWIFLSRYHGMPEQREGVKAAHREWRKARRCVR